jgi:hypothetical protein
MMQTQTLSVAQAHFAADGFYIHAQPVIPRAVVDAAVVGMDEVRAGRYDTGTPPQPSFWQPGDDPNTKLGKIEMPQIANHAIWALLNHPALGELAAEVTGAKAVQIWWVQLLYKPPAQPGAPVSTNVGWHQDRHYWKSWDDDSELFTAWVALSDVTAEAGPMSFVRGSHKWGYVSGQSDFYAQEDQAALRQQIQAATGDAWEEVTAILPPGGVSFHHSLTYHGSGPNHSGAPRRSFAIHMRTEKSRPRDGLRQGLTQFIDNLDYCPVIFGQPSDFQG